MERKACFLVGTRKERTPLRPRDQKVVLISPRVPAGLCCFGGYQPHVWCPHYRITCPRRPRGPATHSTAWMVGELRHAPINDSFFMKKEQSNGNLCCIESARERARQASLDSWTLCIPPPTPRSSGVKEVKQCKTCDPQG